MSQYTDKELLELAAKAAGYDKDVFWDEVSKFLWDGEGMTFDPLNDDGDALRLAVKLNLGISIPVHKTIRSDVVCFRDSSVSVRKEGGDPYAATRRAITRAAAEIGKEMK